LVVGSSPTGPTKSLGESLETPLLAEA
jgi:hypothetical protein